MHAQQSTWRRRLAPALAACALVLGAAPTAAAQPLDPADVPEELRGWIPWVLDGVQEELHCTRLLGVRGAVRCAWAGPLRLDVDDRGARLAQRWLLDHEGWVPLSGDDSRRPVEARVGGRPATVLVRDGRPGLLLPAGEHQVEARFTWRRAPSSLPVPPEVGIVRLTLRGEPVEQPRRERDGVLWLDASEEATAVEPESDALRIVVHRKLIDSVPFLVETQVELHVSGRSREELVGPVLLPGSAALRVETPLPARLEGTSLRVQVRPGTWTLKVVGRFAGRVEELRLPRALGPNWPRSEVWVLAPRPEHREVEVEGAPPVDPQQTLLPADWRALRAWRLEAGGTLRLHERRRGAQGREASESVSLERSVWLDFDGGGATVRDVLEGDVGSRTRLQARPPLRLLRVRVDGHDQLVSRLGDGPAGVELRRRRVRIEAEGRLEGGIGSLAAVAWDVEPRQVLTRVHLPPGWHLWGAFGADTVEPSAQVWLDSWNLFEMFVLLLLTVASWRLWGAGVGGLVFVVVLLVHPAGFDAAWWIPWLALEAIRRALPKGTFRQLFGWAEAAWAVLVILVAVGFGIDQVRAALHPALEPRGGGTSWSAPMADTAYEAAPEPMALEESRARPARRKAEALGGLGAGGGSAGARGGPAAAPLSYEVDPEAAVQTGPGLPSWRWRTVTLQWHGPVAPDHRVRLWLSPPWLSSLVGYLRVLLLGLLLWWAGRGSWRADGDPGSPRSASSGAARRAAAAASLLLALGWSATARAEPPRPPASPTSPDAQLLSELRQRLLRPPACAPQCASLERLRLELRPDRVGLALRFGVQARTAVPLPVDVERWRPEQVLVDGKVSAATAVHEGRLWLRLPEGHHEVRLAGPAPPTERLQVPLPARPALVEVDAQGWEVSGLRPDGTPEEVLAATRVREAPAGDGEETRDGAQPPRVEVPPFVRVERFLRLGLQWRVETTVVRLGPTGRAVPLAIEALAGERVTSAEARLEGGRVHVQLGPEQRSLTWHSVLEPHPELLLRAARSPLYVERWSLEASPIWHVEYEGPPPLHRPAEDEVLHWQPWPGETLRIQVARPKSAGGPTTTVDRAELHFSPGQRSTDATLSLRLRSSRGGPFRIGLAPGAQVSVVRVDGEERPVSLKDGALVVDLAPGASTVDVSWRDPRAISAVYQSPLVRLQVPATNVQVTVEPGEGRWTLWTSGPRLGPAVLFWGVLLVLVVVALLLGRWRRTPLRTVTWLLLLVGLSQIPVLAAAVVVGWLLFVTVPVEPPEDSNWSGLLRAGRALMVPPWTLVVLGILVFAVHRGLLGHPDMQIEGNGSSAAHLVWYADRSGERLPQPLVYSAPMLVYRLAMLAWALWLAFAMLRWLRAAWDRFSEGGSWGWIKSRGPRPARSPAQTGTTPSPSATPEAAPPAASRATADEDGEPERPDAEAAGGGASVEDGEPERPDTEAAGGAASDEDGPDEPPASEDPPSKP